MKLVVLLLVLSVCVSLCLAARRERVVLTASSSPGNATLSPNKLQSFVGNCDDDGVCPPVLFSVNLPEVLFRPNVRDIGLKMLLANVTCHTDQGQPVACPNYTQSTGMSLLMVNNQDVPVQGANFTAWQLGKLTNEYTAQNLKQNQVYTIKISAPINTDDTLVFQFAGQVEAIYSTKAPGWVIAVLVLGGLLVIFLLCAIFYCLWKRFSSNQNGYESFD